MTHMLDYTEQKATVHDMPENNSNIGETGCDMLSQMHATIDQQFNNAINELNRQKYQIIQKLELIHESNDYIGQCSCNTENIELKFDHQSLQNFVSIANNTTTDKILSSVEEPLNIELIKPQISIFPTFNHTKNDLQLRIKFINFDSCWIKTCIEYKSEILENQRKLRNENKKADEWKIVKNDSNVIEKIEPFQRYFIRSKVGILQTYDEQSNVVWSDFCEPIEYYSDFVCTWNSSLYPPSLINYKFMQFENISNCACIAVNHVQSQLYCTSNCKTLNIIAQPTLDCDIFSSIKFEFIINKYCQTSMFGFIDNRYVSQVLPTEDECNADILPSENSSKLLPLISHHKHAYILNTMKGLAYVHRYQRGKDKEKGLLFSDPGIPLKKAIANGDHFIFDVDFKTKLCNVFINDGDKIGGKAMEIATFTEIPSQITPVYTHYYGCKLVARSSKVIIHVLEYQLR